jgi:hypothetical protein
MHVRGQHVQHVRVHDSAQPEVTERGEDGKHV